MDIPEASSFESPEVTTENLRDIISDKIKDLNSNKSSFTIKLDKVIEQQIIDELEQKGYVVDYVCLRTKSKQMVNTLTVTNPKLKKTTADFGYDLNAFLNNNVKDFINNDLKTFFAQFN